MGNSGFRKIFFQGPQVETPYTSLYDMSIIDIVKEEVPLSTYKNTYSIVINTASGTAEDKSDLMRIQALAQNGISIILFPSNTLRNENLTYEQIRQTYATYFKDLPNIHVMQKVEINGHYTHPVYRFLKRHSPALYNAELCQGRNIPSDFCAFLVNRSGMPVKFLQRKEDLSSVIREILLP